MDSEEFQNIILPLVEKMFPLARRLMKNDVDAEDVIQEVMMKLWHNRNSWEKYSNPIGYAIRMTRNACLDRIKKSKPELSAEPLEFSQKYETDQIYDEREASKIIYKIVSELPEIQRLVLELRDFDGFEMKEIAESMKIEVSYARVLLSRSRKIVREKMIKNYGYERRTI